VNLTAIASSFKVWWFTAKYTQVVSSDQATERIARDAFNAGVLVGATIANHKNTYQD
jgi:hypothetical protein